MGTQKSLKAQDIETWLAQHLGELLGLSLSTIDKSLSFDRYGLDSSAAISVTESLGRYVGRDLDPTLLQDFPTIQSLALHLSKEA